MRPRCSESAISMAWDGRGERKVKGGGRGRILSFLGSASFDFILMKSIRD